MSKIPTHRVPLVDSLVGRLRRRGLRGAGTLIRLAGRCVTSSAVTAMSKHGVRFRLRLGDYIDAVVLREGYYESEVLEALLDALPRAGVLWDVGANFGLHAVTVKVLRPDIRVVCFDPSPAMSARVIEHAALNQVAVEVLCVGLGRRGDYLRLHMVSSGNPGMTTFVPWSGATYDSVMLSRTEAGDELIRLGVAPAPDVVKIDVEGSEVAVLDGLAETLAGPSVSALVFEGGEELAAEAGRRGFGRLKRLDRSESTHHSLTNYLVRRA